MINSTAFPKGYGLGETWDREALHTMGEVMSNEARYYSQKTGHNVLCLWSPNADIARDPLAQLCNLSEEGVRYHIKKLKKEGYVKRAGRSIGHWEVIKLG